MISTDQTKINALLTRGVQEIFPKRDFLKSRLESGEQLTIYTGYDPTGPSLHIGHGITLLKLRQFQQLGHKIIFLIGDMTATIGDPTDKGAARTRLTREEVLENCKEYQKQASQILDFDGDNPVVLRYNSEWWNDMNFAETLELASHFTVQQMIQRDMFQKRLEEEKPIFLHEFLYPLMQGYDSVAMEVDGEVGGNDQMFNMLAGRALQKDIQNKEKFVITMRLLTASDGKKMGKSEGNMIAFNDTPEDMFGKIMTWGDDMIVNAFELCTTLPIEEIDAIHASLKDGANPRDAKLQLAYEITKTFLGEAAAEQGKAHFASVIQGDAKPEDMPEVAPSAPDIVTTLVESELVSSKSEARRAIEQGGVRVNDEKITAFDHAVAAGDVIQKGKRHFVRVV